MKFQIFAFLFSTFCAVSALYESKYKVSYDSTLEKKCDLLTMFGPAVFVGDRCFAATTEKYNVPLEDWHTLNSKCTHINGYRSRMANIYAECQLDILLEREVISASEKYFVGARQNPTDDEESIPCCSDPRHEERWFYFDENNQQLEALNTDLWLKDQPDNTGSPPEFVVALERLNTSNKLGFNDINPGSDSYAVLCEYVDFLQCPDGWNLLGSECIKVSDNIKTLDEARLECSMESEVSSPHLASIHNDKENRFFTALAQAKITAPLEATGDLSHNPVMFGLSYSSNLWSYDNGDLVDYFRWYHKAGMGITTSFFGEEQMVALLNTAVNGAQGESRLAYWTIGDGKTERYHYICVADPIVVD